MPSVLRTPVQLTLGVIRSNITSRVKCHYPNLSEKESRSFLANIARVRFRPMFETRSESNTKLEEVKNQKGQTQLILIHLSRKSIDQNTISIESDPEVSPQNLIEFQ